MFSSNLIIKNTNVLHTEYLDHCYTHIYIERKNIWKATVSAVMEIMYCLCVMLF